MTEQAEFQKSKRWMCFCMCLAVTAWGLGYVFAKNALEVLDPLCLVFYKYVVALALVAAIRFRNDRSRPFRKKDIWLLLASVVFGEIVYFYAEYSALAFMPISLLTIILSFTPIVAIAIEAVVYRRLANKKVVVGIFVCVAGIALVIGFDWHVLLEGRIYGYLLAFTCVICWNVYNFVTASLHERYTTVTLTLNQLILVVGMLLPYALAYSPPLAEFTPALIGGLLYIGLISSGLGFLILVRALHFLGPTTTVLFSNFLPVSATFFGWLLLNETIAPLQCVGGAVVIGAGYVVINEKGKLDERKDR